MPLSEQQRRANSLVVSSLFGNRKTVQNCLLQNYDVNMPYSAEGVKPIRTNTYDEVASMNKLFPDFFNRITRNFELCKNFDFNFYLENLHGMTPLHAAIINRNLDLIKDLIAAGARLDPVIYLYVYKRTSSEQVEAGKSKYFLQAIISNISMLNWALLVGNSKIFAYILQTITTESSQQLARVINFHKIFILNPRNGFDILISSKYRKQLAAVLAVCDLGADSNCRLSYTTHKDWFYKDIKYFYIQVQRVKGYDSFANLVLNQELLLNLGFSASKKIIKLLLEMLNTEQRNYRYITRGNITLVHSAILAEDVEYLRYLLQLGLKPDVVDINAKPPMWYAARMKQHAVTCINLLAEAGAGQELLHEDQLLIHAVRRQNLEYVDLLLKIGIDPNVKDQLGNTPLHFACGLAPTNVEIIRKLAQAGADLNQANHLGQLPIGFCNNQTLVDAVQAAFPRERKYSFDELDPDYRPSALNTQQVERKRSLFGFKLR